MILSTQTDYLGRTFGERETVRLIADAGFDAIDLTLFGLKNDDSPFLQENYREYARSLRQDAESRGLFFNQSHAPFPCSKDDDAYNTMIFDRLTRSIEIAGIVGAKCIVVHPMHHLPYSDHRDELREINKAFYKSLAPYAKKAGVRIALENMWQRNPETKQIVISTCSRARDFIEYLDMLADDCFVACLDLGHCGLCGMDAAEVIRSLGSRLFALHVHDNDYLQDAHTVPYLGKMHWDTICEALAKINYKGDFTFEADKFLMQFGPELAPDAIKFAAAIGRKLIKDIDSFR